MPTSVDVTNLKINTLTEAQYDAAVQGGVIGANELSVITDLDEAIQVSTMPVASADELGKVYQFIGTTGTYTHGYFYECVSDGQNPATYSWTQVNVQPAPSGLPDQTGQSGKFLTTDGTDASWSDKPLVNTALGSDSLTLLGTPVPANHEEAVNIGSGTSALRCSVAIGYNAKTSTYGVAIGSGAECTGSWANNNQIAIGYNARIPIANNKPAIQLGEGSNNTNNTFQVWNYTLLDKTDGTIPADRLKNAINKYSSMPTAASTNEGWIVQYTGTTDSTYTHGHLYECVSDGGNPATYSWTEVSMGGGGSSYTAGTGIDITSGVISVTGPTLVNTATGANALVISNDPYVSSSSGMSVSINGSATGSAAICIGYNAKASASKSIAIGNNAQSNSNAEKSVGIGGGCGAAHAIQIGMTDNTFTTNNDANTFKVANANGNFELMDANGNLPADRLASTSGLADGNYRLRLTMSSGTPTLSWVAE